MEKIEREREGEKTAKAIFTCQTVINWLGTNSFYSSELKQNNATPNRKQTNKRKTRRKKNPTWRNIKYISIMCEILRVWPEK